MKAVTDDTVRIWRKEADRLAKELEGLYRKIEAAEVLGLGMDDESERQKSSDERDEPVPDAILRALEGTTYPWAYPAHIRRWLLDRGFDRDRFGANGNYLYTSLKRLTERERIEKDEKGRYRLSKSEP